MITDEWQYVVNSRDCFVSRDGEVQQGGVLVEPFRYGKAGHRAVNLYLETREYDYVNGSWAKAEQTVLVWQLMQDVWFGNWPSDCDLHFVDGDPWNCSVENIRVWSPELHRIVRVREEDWAYIFDKRVGGQVEIVELEQVVSGVTEAARAVGGTKSGVSLVLSGHLETHKKYHFRWV